jgi:phosphohistidine phosphatase
MRIYLAQHGNANPEEVDPKKRLSEKGKSDVAKVTAFLKKELGGRIYAIYHSDKERAIETAEIMGRELGVKIISQKEGLAPNDPIESTTKFIESEERDTMIVGHLPHLSKLAGALVSGDENNPPVLFEQGGVAALDKTPEGWKIVWFVTPSLIE